MKMLKTPVSIGERLVVHGISFEAKVESVNYLPKENRWEITLDWGSYGKSRVYDTDENKTWYRFSKVN